MKFFKEVTLKHPSGISARLPVGWSFSPFFFGPLVHLFSGLYAYGFFMLGVSVILFAFTFAFTFGFGNVILNIALMENLNRKIIEKHLMQGYEFTGDEEEIKVAKFYVED